MKHTFRGIPGEAGAFWPRLRYYKMPGRLRRIVRHILRAIGRAR